MQPYLDIINHFGFRAQMKKLNEEVYELLEAVDNYEDAEMEQEAPDPFYTITEMEVFRDHIVEEMGDVLILLTQFLAKYDIKKYELDNWMDYKLARTKERIRVGYYDKNEK